MKLAHTPPSYSKRVVYAMQAMENGVADEDQQKLVLKWIIDCAGTYDLSYRPDDNSATNFSEGKRFVGLQIIKLLKLNPANIKDEK